MSQHNRPSSHSHSLGVTLPTGARSSDSVIILATTRHTASRHTCLDRHPHVPYEERQPRIPSYIPPLQRIPGRCPCLRMIVQSLVGRQSLHLSNPPSDPTTPPLTFMRYLRSEGALLECLLPPVLALVPLF